ncbi:hypothetical protein ASD04_02790 [Devosia sp. Root436]|nr:hypothetical protein ASD04_02790 [Devosia sp. Root436]
MDEILSSIRQIIADDDAAGVPRRPTIQAAPPPMQATPARPMADSLDRDLSDMLDDIEPLALSPNQIVDGGDDDIGGFSFDSILADTATEEPSAAAAPQLVEPDDITFDVAEPAEEEELPAFDPPPVAAPRPQASVAQAAPLPDPTLSSDMADQLLGPATQAAVRSSITKLNGLGLGNAGATIESLMRDMLRPMLKEWLDENLPSVVERMVEREITRLSRGE